MRAPTLALDGGRSSDWLRATARAVADAIPDGRHATLQGEDHGVLRRPEALRAPLVEFFR